MKKIYLLLLASLSAAMLQAQNIMVLEGSTCTYDTLVHRSIAPGATYTMFQFHDIKSGNFTNKMRVHVIRIDMQNEYNSLTPYLSNNKYFSINTQAQEVKKQKAQGLKPVASINAGWFMQGNSTSTTSNNYEMEGGVITRGEVKYETSKATTVLYISPDKVPHMDNIRMNATVGKDGATTKLHQINHFRDIHPDGLSLFCNGMTKSQCSTDKAYLGREVRLKLLSGDKILVGNNQCVVTELLSGCKNTMQPGDVVLSSEKGQGLEYISSLKVGDKLDINIAHANAEGIAANIMDVVTAGFGVYVKEGVAVKHNAKNSASTSIGMSKDGRYVYLSVLEISANSNGTYQNFAEMMANIGIWNAIQLDGGPSAEMTLDGDWATVNSIGLGFNGRFIPNGFILYSTAPDDNTVTSIETENRRLRRLSIGETTALKVYGYNRYGEMVNPDAQKLPAVSISCTEGLGTIQNGIFTATASGRGSITIGMQGQKETITIPIEVLSQDYISVYPRTIFTGQEREVQAQLQLIQGSKTTTIDPTQALWKQSNRYVVKDCSGGHIVPFIDGRSSIYVDFQGLRDTISVTVENLEEDVDYIVLRESLEESEIHIPSVPLSVEVNVRGMAGAEVEVPYTTGGRRASLKGIIPDSGILSLTITPNYDAADSYPISVLPVSGANLSSITAYYTEGCDAITHATEGKVTMDITPAGIVLSNTSGQPFQGKLSIHTLNGAMLQSQQIDLEAGQTLTLPLSDGGIVVTALTDSEGRLITSKACF